MNRTTRPVIAVRAFLLFGLCLAAGCSTVRQAREIQKGATHEPGEYLLQAKDVGLTSNSVLTLDRALSIALTHHPSIFQARQSVIAATAQVYQAKAAYWPQISASAGQSLATGNTEGSPGGHDSDGSFSTSLGLSLLVYDFGKTPAQVRQAYGRLISAQESLRSARSDLGYAVRSAFFTLGKTIELEQVAEDAMRQYQDHLNQVHAFRDVGRRTRYDVTKAEVDLGNARLEMIKARNDISDARAGLNRYLGLAEEPGYAIDPGTGIRFDAMDVNQLMIRARRDHPGLLLLRAEEAVASAAVDEAIANLFPEIGLQAKYGLGGARFPLVWNWSTALQSSLQLFTGGQQRWNITSAVTQLRSARSKVADKEQQIYQDLENAMNQLASSEQRLSLTELLVRQAQESLDLVNERYRVGAATSVEVTDAQVALTGARAERVKAKFDHEAAVAQLKHAIGEE